MAGVKPLLAEEARWQCDESRFSFETTGEVEPLGNIVGQERAIKAMDFGLDLSNHGYNLYVLGEGGTGKISTVKAMIEKKAASEPRPDDWCYIFNFKDPDKPCSLRLPPGKGLELKRDTARVITSLHRDIPMVFESKDYEKHRDEILDGQQERTKDIFHKLEQLAIEKGAVLKKSAGGLAIVPAKDGKPMKQEDYEALSRAERETLDEAVHFLQDRLGDAIREARKVEKETKARVKELDQEMVRYIINPLIGELTDKYIDFKRVTTYLERIREEIFANIDDFRPREEIHLPGIKMPDQEPTFERYSVNLLVDNSETEGAPVIVDTNPTYYNLLGRIEHRVQYGVATTDFSMIKGGSAHRANGGYLVMQAIDVLRNIFVYDALKRMVKNKEVRIEDAWEQYRLVSTTTLKPEPIPIDVKIVLIGEPYIYYMLFNLDSDYRKLFKVKADFESDMPRNDDTVLHYAGFIAARVAQESLLHFDRSAVARVVEYGVRFAEDKEKITARFAYISSLVTEASYWAKRGDCTLVSAEHVDKAHLEKKYRDSRIEDKLQELITEDSILVDTEGSVVGQVNGLAVLDLGDYRFGKPSRITARTFMGDAGVVNIEREVKMSGRIHNKALMILSSFLGERYAQSIPLTLSASICFEQLYGQIEGDSATCTEVYALLSSVSQIPLDQGIAVTGSMNQLGEVQPIGGANEKIEGFFDVCEARGLTGSQGVIIPKRNVKNLMLKHEVVAAVKAGDFAIYPIEMVDEGLAILTGMEVGSLDENGDYKEGTLNRLIAERLKKLATGYKAFGRPPVKKAPKANSNDGGKNNDK